MRQEHEMTPGVLISGDDMSAGDYKARCSVLDQRVLELEAERADLILDKARLDFLDRMNAALNQRYGTSYKWKLILSPNVVRLMTGMQNNGYVGDVDLNDSNANGEQSCRHAIDAALARQGKESN